MRFSDIPGHETEKNVLRELVATGHLPHALMISGAPGTGKTLLARAFAQYVHCESPQSGEPCGHCAACRLHEESAHPDLHFIYPIAKNKSKGLLVSANLSEQWDRFITEYPTMPEEKWLEILEAGNSQIGIHVEEADELVRADSIAPFASNRKIFIIWQPERMNAETANKLLKVIEEPSDDTLFVMVSNNELQVLPTIFSRVQRIHAGGLSDSEIAAYLTSRFHFPEHQAAQYARLCEGSLTRALELGSRSGENEEFLTLYQEIMRSAYAKRVANLRQLSEKIHGFGREKIKRYLSYTARMIRENFIFNMKMPPLTVLTPEEEAFSQRFSPFVNHANVEDFLAETDRAMRDIGRNANARIVMFDYFVTTIILLHRKPK